MSKPRWQEEIEEGLKQLEAEVSQRRGVTQYDPGADGIVYAVKEMRTRVATLTAPGRELTPAEYGAEHDPVLSEQTVRNYIKQGRIKARPSARGALILATAKVEAPGTHSYAP